MNLVETTRSGRVTLITLNDPDRRNLLSAELCRGLSAAVAAANDDPHVKAIILTGAGSAFCAGANLEDLQAAAAGKTTAIHLVYQSFLDVANSPLPTIAAVNGAAVGAGFNLALACDVRVATANAMFDTRFMKLGLHPGGGHSWLLARAVGWAEASRLLLFGQTVRGDEALRIGLVQSLVSAEELEEAANALGQRAEAVPRDLLLRTKASLRRAETSSHAESVEHETGEQFWSLGQPAFAELVRQVQASIASR